ncbi:MAG: hypothetical protein R3249_11810 [Nitriliruptorales bacterium]|nr:hypothetical protein [Nitriliruptorales bacterium]
MRQQDEWTSLARSSMADVAAAHALAVDLVAAARHLTSAARHIYVPEPYAWGEPCRGNGCLLGDRPGGAVMCSLARRLSGLDVDTSDHPPADDLPGAFVRALEHSFEAVRTCRQTLHPAGMCWFAGVEGVDGCGEILQAAHALVD